MTIRPIPPIPPRAPTRHDIEVMIAVAWNDEGARRGLLPLAWKLGPDDFVHFIGSATAYASESRKDVIEDWIAALGLADNIDLNTSPLHQRGPDMIWAGHIDGIGIEFSYPATITA
ncbi:hypothetical protein DZF95_03580 [Clavibacter michiganensis]|nr:hypothetical protein DZF95_03580 [Clavibacter michiganensis]